MSRNRKGVHVFLHWYRLEFNDILKVQKQRTIGDNYMYHNNHNHNEDKDGNDDNNVIFQYPVIAQLGLYFGDYLVNV